MYFFPVLIFSMCSPCCKTADHLGQINLNLITLVSNSTPVAVSAPSPSPGCRWHHLPLLCPQRAASSLPPNLQWPNANTAGRQRDANEILSQLFGLLNITANYGYFEATWLLHCKQRRCWQRSLQTKQFSSSEWATFKKKKKRITVDLFLQFCGWLFWLGLRLF